MNNKTPYGKLTEAAYSACLLEEVFAIVQNCGGERHELSYCALGGLSIVAGNIVKAILEGREGYEELKESRHE